MLSKLITWFLDNGGDLYKIIIALITLIEEAERPGEGPQKRAEVIDGLMLQLDKEGGLDAPKWLSSFLKTDLGHRLVGLLVDAIVRVLNLRGNG